MSEPINLPINADDLYDPPLVDCIYIDQQKKGFAVTFVPSDDASSALKEFVFIVETAPDHARVLTFWSRIQELIGGRIERIVHAGGGNYTIHFTDGSNKELAAIDDSEQAVEISDRLKQIADAAQIAFLDRSYTTLAPRGA